jgi:hypothetical protein
MIDAVPVAVVALGLHEDENPHRIKKRRRSFIEASSHVAAGMKL